MVSTLAVIKVFNHIYQLIKVNLNCRKYWGHRMLYSFDISACMRASATNAVIMHSHTQAKAAELKPVSRGKPYFSAWTIRLVTTITSTSTVVKHNGHIL